MKKIIFFIPVLLCACAGQPKCGYPEGNRIIYQNQKTCAVRIRQVTIGSELKIPESFKGPGVSAFELTWVDPGLVNGEIIFGHFAMIKKTSGSTK